MKRFLIATAVLLLFPLTAFSQGPNGGDALQQLVETALKSNPGLKAQRTKVQAAEKRPSQARALPDPTASLEMMMISTDHFDASKALSNGISVGLSQRLPYPGKLKLREQKAQREVTVAQARLSAMESKITGEVKAASYQYALYQRLLSINQDTHDALSAAAQGAAGAYSAGTGTQVDVLLAQTALTKNRADRKDLEKQLRIVKSHLDDLLGGNAPESLLKRVPLPEPSHILPLQDLLSSLPKTAPDVQIAKNLESVQETDVAIARKNFKPDFMVEGRYRHHDVSMGGGNYLTAMVGITLPFFHYKSRYRPALQQAELERQNAGYQTDSILNGVRYRFLDAYRTSQRDREVYALYKNGLLIQSKQAYESSLSAYTVGKVDFTTLLKALTNYFRYRGQAVMAQADFQVSLARMQETLGRPVTASRETGK